MPEKDRQAGLRPRPFVTTPSTLYLAGALCPPHEFTLNLGTASTRRMRVAVALEVRQQLPAAGERQDGGREAADCVADTSVPDLSWGRLSEAEQEAARELGLDEESWGCAAAAQWGGPGMRWGQESDSLSQGMQDAFKRMPWPRTTAQCIAMRKLGLACEEERPGPATAPNPPPALCTALS